MKRYPTYKPSGVEWLGEVPLDWELWKVSRLYKKIGSGTTPKAGNPEFYENGTIPWVNTGDLNDGYISDCSNYITQKAFDEHSALKINDAGTLLVAMYGATIGKIAITEFAACTNQACCSLAESKLIDTKFAFYWFIANKENVVNLSYGGGQPNISQDIIKGLKIPICKIDEQHSIVRFLDYKTAQIDSFIANRQKQIELLKEQKAGIINKAVTKGINPNAKIKASGIDWIGDIPEHWRVMELKRLINPNRKITYGIVQPGDLDPNGRFMIRGQDYSKGWANNETIFRVSDVIEKSYKRSRVITGDIILTIVGAGCGNLEIIPEWLDGANLTQTTARIAIDQRYHDSKFIYYSMLSEIGQANVNIYLKGAAQPGLNLGHVAVYKYPIPPKNEQELIRNYIENEILERNNLIDKYQKQIELMQEYRTSLISQAVTGKIDVRDWKPKIKEYSIEKPDNLLVAEE